MMSLGNDGGMSSDCSDDEGSPGGGSGGHMPVVYPWMKKIHVSGAGIGVFLFVFFFLYVLYSISWTLNDLSFKRSVVSL